MGRRCRRHHRRRVARPGWAPNCWPGCQIGPGGEHPAFHRTGRGRERGGRGLLRNARARLVAASPTPWSTRSAWYPPQARRGSRVPCFRDERGQAGCPWPRPPDEDRSCAWTCSRRRCAPAAGGLPRHANRAAGVPGRARSRTTVPSAATSSPRPAAQLVTCGTGFSWGERIASAHTPAAAADASYRARSASAQPGENGMTPIAFSRSRRSTRDRGGRPLSGGRSSTPRATGATGPPTHRSPAAIGGYRGSCFGRPRNRPWLMTDRFAVSGEPWAASQARPGRPRSRCDILDGPRFVPAPTLACAGSKT